MKFPKPKNMDEFMLQEKAKENPSFYFMLKKKKDIIKLFEQDLLCFFQQVLLEQFCDVFFFLEHEIKRRIFSCFLLKHKLIHVFRFWEFHKIAGQIPTALTLWISPFLLKFFVKLMTFLTPYLKTIDSIWRAFAITIQTSIFFIVIHIIPRLVSFV